MNRTKKSLESSTVTSTIAGIIQEINPDPGYDDYSGEKQAFMSILSTGKYRIKGKISEQNIGELQPGMDVTVRARNNQEEIWKGSVDVIDTEKPESSSQSEMYSGSDSSARATKYPFYVTLETSDGLMLGQHVYIEPGTGVNTEGLHLMTAPHHKHQALQFSFPVCPFYLLPKRKALSRLHLQYKQFTKRDVFRFGFFCPGN